MSTHPSLIVSSLLVCLLCVFPVHAQAQERIGVVLTARGQASARAADGTVRQLQRRMPLYTGDTLLTDAAGLAQIRMVDDAMLSLGRNTRLTFIAYEFDGNPRTVDRALITLETGCFRTVSGQIGDAAQDELSFETPLASIGVRGTAHAVAYDGAALYTATYEGGTTVSNALGALDVGLGSVYDFSYTTANAAPAGIVAVPDALRNCAVQGAP